MKKYIILVVICLFIGFVVGRQTIKEQVITKHVKGESIRDTVFKLIPDTVYLTGELKYKYVYKTDTIYKDVPVIDRDATLTETMRDWNLVRDYKKTLIDGNNGKLVLDLSVQYNELQHLSYSFTPMRIETVARKEKVFVPFISVALGSNDKIFVGGGFFCRHVGLRVEWTSDGGNLGVMYKF